MSEKFKELPYLEKGSFPPVAYGKAGAMRGPILAAINEARLRNEQDMEDVRNILLCALDHIDGAETYDKPTTCTGDSHIGSGRDDNSSALERMLADAEAVPYAGTGGDSSEERDSPE